MSHSHQPSGLRGRIEFLIDPGWSPEQAFAVVELLDDLRNRIWAHYAICGGPARLDSHRGGIR